MLRGSCYFNFFRLFFAATSSSGLAFGPNKIGRKRLKFLPYKRSPGIGTKTKSQFKIVSNGIGYICFFASRSKP